MLFGIEYGIWVLIGCGLVMFLYVIFGHEPPYIVEDDLPPSMRNDGRMDHVKPN